MAVLLAIVVTNACMAVECAITSIFVCCFKDLKERDGEHMSPSLRSAFDLPPHYPKTDGDGKPVTSDTPKLTDAKDGVDENVRV